MMNNTYTEITKDHDLKEYIESETFLEIIGEGERLYTSEESDLPYHLTALKALCSFAKYHNLDVEWIYTAFNKELKGKQKTALQRYYLGGLVKAMIEKGTSENQSLKILGELTGTSKRHIQGSYYLFKKNAFNFTSPLPILLKENLFEVAIIALKIINKDIPKKYTVLTKIQAEYGEKYKNSSPIVKDLKLSKED